MKQKLTEWIGKTVAVTVHGTGSELEGVLKEVGDDHVLLDDDDVLRLIAMVFVTDVYLNE